MTFLLMTVVNVLHLLKKLYELLANFKLSVTFVMPSPRACFS